MSYLRTAEILLCAGGQGLAGFDKLPGLSVTKAKHWPWTQSVLKTYL